MGVKGEREGRLRDFWPYVADMPRRSMPIMPIDLGTVLLALAGLGVAVGFAVLAGTVSARVFFDASRPETKENR